MLKKDVSTVSQPPLSQYKLVEEIYFSGLHSKHKRFQLQSVAFNDFPGDLG